MKKLSAVLMLLIVAFALTGCETTEGVGRDLQNAGDEIEDAT
jgi:entericidin B